VVFNGDGYSEEWHNEAERRGLPNLKNTVDALPVIVRKDAVELFGKYKVFTERELTAGTTSSARSTSRRSPSRRTRW
jgi:glutamine synthetase